MGSGHETPSHAATFPRDVPTGPGPHPTCPGFPRDPLVLSHIRHNLHSQQSEDRKPQSHGPPDTGEQGYQQQVGFPRDPPPPSRFLSQPSGHAAGQA